MVVSLSKSTMDSCRCGRVRRSLGRRRPCSRRRSPVPLPVRLPDLPRHICADSNNNLKEESADDPATVRTSACTFTVKSTVKTLKSLSAAAAEKESKESQLRRMRRDVYKWMDGSGAYGDDKTKSWMLMEAMEYAVNVGPAGGGEAGVDGEGLAQMVDEAGPVLAKEWWFNAAVDTAVIAPALYEWWRIKHILQDRAVGEAKHQC